MKKPLPLPGMTVATWNESIRVMSDEWGLERYACWYDRATLKFHRGPALDGQTADASEDIHALYEAWKIGQAIAHAIVRLERAENDALCALAQPARGRIVEVVKGRKVPIGTKGVVVWAGDSQYGERVGIKDADGQLHYTASSNVRTRIGARFEHTCSGKWCCKACDLHAAVLVFETVEDAAVHMDVHMEAGETVDPNVVRELSGKSDEHAAECAMLARCGWRRNQFGKRCEESGEWVPEREGWIVKVNGEWRTYSHVAALEAYARFVKPDPFVKAARPARSRAQKRTGLPIRSRGAQ